MAGHDYSHQAYGLDPLPAARRLTLALLIPAVLLTALGMFLLWPRHAPQATAASNSSAQVKGEIQSITPAACTPAPSGEVQPTGCGTAAVKLATGEVVSIELPYGPVAIVVEPGDRVMLLTLNTEDGGIDYSLADH
jgi:hypothetical protein